MQTCVGVCVRCARVRLRACVRMCVCGWMGGTCVYTAAYMHRYHGYVAVVKCARGREKERKEKRKKRGGPKQDSHHTQWNHPFRQPDHLCAGHCQALMLLLLPRAAPVTHHQVCARIRHKTYRLQGEKKQRVSCRICEALSSAASRPGRKPSEDRRATKAFPWV